MIYKRGYTAGVFDLFHVGHLKMLRVAKSMCEHLTVGVSTNELVQEVKKREPVMSYMERAEIVRAIKYVNAVVPQNTIDKRDIYKKMNFDVLFVGDDHFDTEAWNTYEKSMHIIYLPYTKGLSTTEIINTIRE